ncbi:MAG: hypothetical protein IID31_03280 [Planctomycetes bacterium]|nr:hypothetical protein [Planctomycetota bacterium]
MIRALAPLIALSILVSAPASIAQDTPPPVANNNAALTYWQIWDTLDANLVEVATLVEPDETYEPGRPVTDALLQLQPDIRALMAAANNPHCDWQIDYDAGFDAVLPHLSKMRTTARLFREDARRLSAAVDTGEVVQRVVAIFNLAEQTAGDRVIISPLVGMAIAALATTETDALIAAGDLTADQRDQILATMAVIDQHDPFALADAIAHERDMMTTWVKREFTGDGARDITTLLGGQAPDDLIADLTDLADEDLIKAVDDAATAYDATLAVWFDHDADEKLNDINLAVQNDEYGPIARVITPALTNLREASLKTINVLESTRNRLKQLTFENTDPDSDG